MNDCIINEQGELLEILQEGQEKELDFKLFDFAVQPRHGLTDRFSGRIKIQLKLIHVKADTQIQ